jgi:adenosylhomocysteine nucleosidase
MDTGFISSVARPRLLLLCGNVAMILIFVALKAESYPIRARLSDSAALVDSGLDAYQGRIAGVPVALIATGMGMRRSRISSERAMDSLHGVDLVLISGVAGGLRDDLTVGQVVLSERLLTCRDDFQPKLVVDAPTQWLSRFTAALEATGISYVAGPTITSRRPIITSADKHHAHLQSGGAISVDMESTAVALEAERRGLPFVCMRTILDTASEDVIGARLIDQNGRVRPLTAAKALITNPRMIIGVGHLLRNLRLATRSLASALEAVLPRLQ